MKKTILMASIALSMLFGCEEGVGYYGEYEANYTGFTESEMIIEVTPETKTFRIEVESTYEPREYPGIMIDTVKTSAKHKFHFINTVDVMLNNSLGEFTPIVGTKKSYRDVVIIPENIKERVVIIYTTGFYFTDLNNPEPENIIKELTVILQPKGE